MSDHNDLRDLIARDWQQALTARVEPVLSFNCRCGKAGRELLPGYADGQRVTTEYNWQGKRPDIVVLDTQAEPVGFAEVIDTSPPSAEVLTLYRQADAQVLFVPLSDGRALSAFCGVQCWEERPGTRSHGNPVHQYEPDEKRTDSLVWCEDCSLRLTEREAIIDCTGALCPSCAAPHITELCCWGRDFNGEGRWPGDGATLAEKLAYWDSTDFWRFVWSERVCKPQEPWGGVPDEKLTTSALQYIATAIAVSEWRIAYHLLLTVGRAPLTAWGTENCLEVAQCWEEMEAHAESLFDSKLVRRRPPDSSPLTEREPTQPAAFHEERDASATWPQEIEAWRDVNDWIQGRRQDPRKMQQNS